MFTQAISTQSPAGTDYICVAADLLSTMMSELQSLRDRNQRLALEMAGAGHDLRQRLQLLLGTVELLASSSDKVRSGELSQRIKALIFRLAGELEQLTLQAERDQKRAAPPAHCFCISSLLGRVKQDWESEAAAKYLQFMVASAECLVESDQRLLGVVLNNVVGNAVKHTIQGCVNVAPAVEGQFLILSVSDTGPGISEEDLRRSFIFESRLRGLSEGMGLGLSIARRTAEVLGHKLDVSAGSGGGTCVRVHVPLATHHTYRAGPADSVLPGPSQTHA